MKKREKGFMLVETLVISTLVSTVLVMFYVQFNNIVKNFSNDFKYNNVNDMYAVQNVKEIIMNDDNGNFYANLKKILDENINNTSGGSSNFLEIFTNCTNNSGNSYKITSCEKLSALTNFYGIERIIFTKEFVDLTDNDYEIINDANFEKFIRSIKSEYTAEEFENSKIIYNYRLIVKFSNNEFATLKMSN